MTTLRLVTLNVLAEAYASPRNYSYVDTNALQWNPHRSELINRIVLGSQADLVLLQEVDHPTDISSVLTGTHEILLEARPGSRMDSLLTAWNRSRFTLLDSERVEYDDLSIYHDNNPRLLRHNVATILILRDEATQPPTNIAVVNTHVYWNPSCEDVKLLQVRHLMCACQHVLCRNSLSSVTTPFFLAGDFNSVPNSNVVSYLTTGKIPAPRQLMGFACDDNLYQLTRWLRMLGLDTVVFSLSSLLRGTREYRGEQFLQWQKEGRAMITLSRQLVERRGAPLSHVMDTRGKDLELEFQKIVRRFGAEMFTRKKLFFGRCVKCNQLIQSIDRKNIPLKSIGQGKNVPQFVFDSEEPLFMCGDVNVMAEMKTPLPAWDQKKKPKEKKKGENQEKSPLVDKRGWNYNKKETTPSKDRNGCGQVYWWGKGADGTTTTVNRAISLVKKLQMYVTAADDLEHLHDRVDREIVLTNELAGDQSVKDAKEKAILQYEEKEQKRKKKMMKKKKKNSDDKCDDKWILRAAAAQKGQLSTIGTQWCDWGEHASRSCLFASSFATTTTTTMSISSRLSPRLSKHGNKSSSCSSAESLSQLTARLVLEDEDHHFPFGYGLKSTYDDHSKNHVTNRTPTFSDVLDYIFVNKKTVTIIKTVPVLQSFRDAAKLLRKESKTSSSPPMNIPMLPCETWPSDHLMLCVDVVYK